MLSLSKNVTSNLRKQNNPAGLQNKFDGCYLEE
jgi:hypothetical protein